ncbi:PD-(D/E)XK nuclease family protein [Pedococcus sp. P5_B7]
MTAVNDLNDLSYSGWSRIRACPLRAAFALDPTTSGLDRGNQYSAIGNARHRLVELVAEGRREGRPEPNRRWVRGQFDRCVSMERDRLTEQWSPAEVPPVRSWPDIALTRAKISKELGTEDGPDWPESQIPWPHAEGIAGTFYSPTVPVLPSPGEVATEVTLRDARRALWGRIDRLENRSGVIVVVDFKSGIGASPEELIERHRLQLLFYAGLVHQSYGVWPELELVPVNGRPVHLDYDHTDVESVRAGAVADRARFNADAAAGNLASAVQVSAERCAWCPFQAICPALLSQWSTASSGGAPLGRSVSLARGRVQEVRRHQSSTDVVLAQPQQLTAPAGEVVVTRLPAGLTTSRGDELTVSRVSPAGSDRVVRAQWDTLYWPA